jgi:hypothetical protein
VLGQNQGTSTVDLRPTQHLIINVDISLNPVSRTLSWLLTAIDPTTGLAPSDPLVGVLPPGVEGSVTYSVKSAPTAVSGTIVANQASIVFDTLASMTTPAWKNTIDNTPPTSSVRSLPSVEPPTGFMVAWSGTDVGAGIQNFTIFVSDNGGPFTAWLTSTAATSATFTGRLGHTYAFYSIARDLVGNVEAAKTSAETTTLVASGPQCASDVSGSTSVTRSGYSYSVVKKSYAQTVTLTNTSSAAMTGPISLVLDNLSSNATLSNASGSTSCAAPLASPFLSVVGPLNPGASASVVLQFNDPTKAAISYTTRVLAGSGQR